MLFVILLVASGLVITTPPLRGAVHNIYVSVRGSVRFGVVLAVTWPPIIMWVAQHFDNPRITMSFTAIFVCVILGIFYNSPLWPFIIEGAPDVNALNPIAPALRGGRFIQRWVFRILAFDIGWGVALCFIPLPKQAEGDLPLFPLVFMLLIAMLLGAASRQHVPYLKPLFVLVVIIAILGGVQGVTKKSRSARNALVSATFTNEVPGLANAMPSLFNKVEYDPVVIPPNGGYMAFTRPEDAFHFGVQTPPGAASCLCVDYEYANGKPERCKPVGYDPNPKGTDERDYRVVTKLTVRNKSSISWKATPWYIPNA